MLSPKMQRLLFLLDEKKSLKFDEQKIISSRWFYNLIVFKLEKAEIVRNGNFEITLRHEGKKFIDRLRLLDD